MHPIPIALAAATLALPAQQPAARPAIPELAELRAEWQVANQKYRADLTAIRKSDAYAEARKKKDRAALSKLMSKVQRPDAGKFGSKALALAAKLEDDAALTVLTFTANNLYDEEVFTQMIAQVEKRHLKNPALAGILENGRALNHFIGADQTRALLQRIAAENPHAEPRAWACYWQARLIKMRRPGKGQEAASAEELALADELMAKAEKLAVGTILGDRIAGPKFEKERLQIGMVAPDISGVDTDGVPFKLSDYRGKVVVLDFWGFW